MRIGYLGNMEGEADYLRGQGHDVRKFSNRLAFDVLLYNQDFSQDAFTSGVTQAPAPLFLLNAGNLSKEEIARQICDRTYSDLFR